MNMNEVEEWMKQALDKEAYTPGEEGWQKLHAALKPEEKVKRGFLLLALPSVTRLKIAASVIFVLAAATMVYLNMQRPNYAKKIVVQQNRNIPNAPNVEAKVKEESISLGTPSITTIATVKKPTLHRHIALRESIVNTVTKLAEDSMVKQSTLPASAATENPPLVQGNIETKGKETTWYNVRQNDDPVDRFSRRPVSLGVAAQLGNASVGNMQYQIGVLVHKNISEKLYANTTLALASTQVSHAQQNTFVSVISPGLTNSFAGPSIEQRTIDAKYAQNIVSLGFSPNIGYRINQHFALSCGVTAYRNLSQSISLQNENTIDATAINNNIISRDILISKWNTGATGSVVYYTKRKLAIDVQYRYGLSTYMQLNNRSLRNSGFGIGVNYLFGDKK